MKPKIIFLSLGLLVACLIVSDVRAAILTYPADAPCDTTLQACIDGATNGDTIEIATDDRINEDLTIAKSLTLTSATDFQAIIGSATWLAPRDILIEDSGTGDVVDVTFDHLNFDNARVYVSFSGDDGQNFTMQNSSLSNVIDNNGDFGINLSLRVTTTVLLQNNTLASSGTVINLAISMSDPATADITIVGNTLTGSDPLQSYQGIQVYNDYQGTINLDIQNNLFYNIGTCFCGGPAGVNFRQNGSGAINSDIIGNTMWHVDGMGAGILVDDPTDTGILTLNLYNNSITDSDGYGVYLPAASPEFVLNNDYNNFSNNEFAEHWGGYTAGTNDLAVDPLFVAPENSDFHLQTASLLIDAGQSSITDVDLASTDFAGNTRVVGDGVDLGAYEAASDFSITAAVTNADITVGDEGIILFVVQNNGPDAAVGTVSATLTSGIIDFVSTSSGSCTNTDTTISCTLDAMASGDNATLVVTTLTDTVGDLDVATTVSADRPDSDASNNSTVASITVSAAATNTGDDDADTDISTDAADSGGGGCDLTTTKHPNNSVSMAYAAILFFVMLRFLVRVKARSQNS